jgi:hypothetical protein
MNGKMKLLMNVFVVVVMSASLATSHNAAGQAPGQRPRPVLPPIPIKGDTTHTLTKYFDSASGVGMAPDGNGFIQRWLVLEPIKKDIARNNTLTEKYIREMVAADNFSNEFGAVPKSNKKVKVAGKDYKWYALDTKTFNFNLYHFNYAINKPVYGNLFWIITVINCSEENQNVRMAAGVNSGGMFWLNGKEVLILSGDRDMIADNVTSQPITLKKGRNVVRGAVINGPGMCNFAVRFLDEKGVPLKNFTITHE